MEALLYWLLSTASVGGVLIMILQRNPMAATIGFGIAVLTLAGLLSLAGAPSAAALLTLIGAGACLATAAHIVMLLDLNAEQKRPVRLLAILSGILLAGTLLTALCQLLPLLPPAPVASPELFPPESLSVWLRERYALPLLLLGVAAVVGVVGGVLFTRQEKRA